MRSSRYDDADLDELFALRDVCAAKVATGLDAHSLAAILRQLVQVSASIDDRRPPSEETWLEWFCRRVDDLGDRYGTGDEIEAVWLSENAEPPRPTPRGTPAPFPADDTTDPDEETTA